eukprot:TRINITY_DN12906_c0_g1_i3.p1 TRINITY_DN12906_c0_g1~~TRINITY_DN12906_c0_g1_i3.p1  ORF type:complete len:255 (+),score=65.97 TRINITY_DN12906_c0_g1_i3:61-825(+)
MARRSSISAVSALAFGLLGALSALQAFTPYLSSNLSVRGTTARSSNVLQRRADDTGLRSDGPVAVYSNALRDAAAAKNESVAVTQDVIMFRKLLEQTEGSFMDEMLFIMNQPNGDEITKARHIVETVKKDFKSTVLPKFIVFLAKRQRLVSLTRILREYMDSQYIVNSIKPVIVKSAKKLTKEEAAKIKEKMKEKTGVRDIKLIEQIDATLLAGFTLTWGFTDPEKLENPCEGIDMSLKNQLKKSALNEGVVTA